MEQDAREAASVSRNQNVVHVMPHDWASIAHFLGPVLERVDAQAGELQVLVITADAEAAAAVGAAAVRLAGDPPIQTVAATSATRAGRLLKTRPAQVVAGSAAALLELVRASVLKLGAVRAASCGGCR